MKTDMKKSFYLDSKSGFFRDLCLQISVKKGAFRISKKFHGRVGINQKSLKTQ